MIGTLVEVKMMFDLVRTSVFIAFFLRVSTRFLIPPRTMRKLLFSIAFFICFTAKAQLTAVKSETTYPFWLNTPEDASKKNLQPLLVFLHGKSLSGTDMEKVKRYGVLTEIRKGRKIPAYVVAPQLPDGSWDPDKVLELIRYMKAHYPIDPSRIYVCGMSMGGYGTLHFAGKYPDELTAAVSICGGGNTADACRLARVPLWIQHGDKDYIVPMSESTKIVKAVKACNPNADIKFTEIESGDHSNVERLFHQDALYDWLFSHKK